MRWAPTLGALAALLFAADCGGRGDIPPGAPPAIVLSELAAQGDPEAQVSLGYMYETGRGFEQSYSRAARWYRRAAEQGNALAQYALGELYVRGLGVRQDYAAAAAWYRAAAERGNVSAQFQLAYLYEHGLGVPRDYGAAAAWYARAGQSSQGVATPPPNIERLLGAAAPAPPVLVPPPRQAPVLAAEAVVAEARPPAAAPPPAQTVAATDDESPAAAQTAAAGDEGAASSRGRSGGYWVHVASFRTADSAAAHWDDLKHRHADLLGALQGNLARVDLGADMGVWIRVRAGPLADVAAAKALCRHLRARDVYCAWNLP